MADITGPRPRSNSIRAVNAHRVHSSCDRCRSRKTKCIDPVPGPCRYCARTGAICTTATPRRKRPFYHVTEEEYQLSMSILSKVFRGQQLNLESLRKISKAAKDGSLILPTLDAGSYIEPHQSPEDDDDYSGADTLGEWTVEGENLHEPLGSMMKDSQGVLRYVGAQSDIPFNGAVANFCGPQRKTYPPLEKNTDMIPPARVGAYPPQEEGKEEVFWLPPKELCFHYVKRYREEVHCMYWLYPEARLLQRIEDTYEWYGSAPMHFTVKLEHGTPPPRRGVRPSISWICSIYAMCALGAAPRNSEGRSLSPGTYADVPTKMSEDYIDLVKQLKPKVEDAADIDSIRALAVAAIALENALRRVTAYLYIGTAIQIAWSLGLHRDQLPMSKSEEEREENRRIWWTLTTLDLEIGMRGGSPTLIDERILKVTTSLPLERIGREPMKPEILGIYTPRKWLSTFHDLGEWKRHIIRTMYTERKNDGEESQKISFSTVSHLLGKLREWYQGLPIHLKQESYRIAPEFYRRAIMVLHLHYWSTKILLTRPFLLNLVLNNQRIPSENKIGYEKMANVSVDAAQRSVELFQQMVDDHTISSLTTFDSTAVLRCITIFMCAFGYFRTTGPGQNASERVAVAKQMKECANDCVVIARKMEQIGFAKMIVKETPIHLEALGMGMESTRQYLNASDTPDGHTPPGPSFNLDLTSLQNQQMMGIEFDDPGALNNDTFLVAFEPESDYTNLYQPHQQYQDHSQQHQQWQ
ncbi:uncharacterized protein M421DRAFT_206124 [Didymella exigua CBS 183.55]|uniref:Zn(2)-C6 fungal-type domain-containing protein n=1 Tax=Didymella exigua CBS 183.55 TaxID=1150837 RepID=A0A6A5REP2_9PLEO|nr:uncharacterized protein M421DRAFT_206124 [Didymella exigua CBS 183.55]KAF1926761.1 hypothetical protein M421DRAFT_206124 [Didymella exigua CBS 183.55]